MLRTAGSALRSRALGACYSTSALPAKLPDLDYDYGALEPVISGEIMKLHHSKHHAAYVANFNAGMEKYLDAQNKGDIQTMIGLQQLIKFNGGGHVNHSIFWKNLSPVSVRGGTPPKGPLAKAIDEQFGSLDALQKKMTAASVAVQGSGWGWLGFNKESKKLVLATTMNQDPLVTQGLVPLLGIDVWEHAYYLQYKNVRPDYVNAIWKVIDWQNVADNYAAASQ
eukprot:jgi/Mesvir1/14992/Mv14651-RA.1